MFPATHDCMIDEMIHGYGVRPSRYRLPEATHLGRVTLQVANLERSVEWYQTVLGLRVLERSAAAASLAPHGDSPPLVDLHEKHGVRAVPRRGLLGLYHYALLVPDRAALGRFISHLAALGMQAGMSDHLVSEAVYLSDPDGLGIEIYADRPRTSWRHIDRQLTMATNPLDVRSVVAEAGGMPWTGMPAGTVVGHMHLYVGDIERSAAFYHDAIGFDKIVWNYPGALFMSAGGYHHHLGTNTWAAQSPPASADDALLLEWEIVVPLASDVVAVQASLDAAHVVVAPNARGIVVRDPWGTAVRIRSGA